MPIERRTLYANIQMLKEFGYEISTYQENGHGYYLDNRDFEESEIMLLCNAVHAVQFYSPQAFQRSDQETPGDPEPLHRSKISQYGLY